MRRSESRRKYRRVDYAEDVQVVQGQSVLRCISRDIGRGGIALKSGDLALNRLLKLFVPLPTADKSRLHMMVGKVVWQRDGWVGVHFLDNADETDMKLDDYVRRCAA